MAAGGQPLTRTLKAGCDVYYDFLCSPCERRNGTNSEANHYCTECDELFCKTCLDFHGSFQQSKDHKILGRDKVNSWRKQKKSIKKPAPVFQEQCTRHPGQHVTMFCANHNTVLCHVCVSLEHRNCEGMQYIPDVAAGIKQSQYYTSVMKDFERVQSNINKVKISRQQNKGSLNKSGIDFVDLIKDFRKQVNTIFDNLETNAKTDTDKVLKIGAANADNDLEACDNIKAELERIHQQINTSISDNEYQIFVNVKKFEQTISERDHEVQRLAETTNTISFQMNLNLKITNFLTGLQNLGELVLQNSKPSSINTVKQVLVYKKKVIEKENPRVYRAQTTTKHNVKIISDTQDCHITGSCVMPDGSIILTDYKNYKLKRLKKTFHVINHCDLSCAPRAVCCVGQQEVAVAVLPYTISFVFIDKSKMCVTRSIDTGKACDGIAYNNNKLYVSETGGKVSIYNMSGKCLSTIHKNQNGDDIFSTPKHMAVCPNGRRIYVANCHKGLVVLDDSGRHLSTYDEDADVEGAYGVCADDKGSVFVGCCRSNNVVQLSGDGTRKLGIVAQLEDGESLESICLDKGQESLIVTLESKTYIKVCRLK